MKETPPEGGLTTHDPSTIIHYLVDQGVQVVEILDETKRDPIGNTWLFVPKNKRGEPILIADNVEIHRDYMASHLNDAICDHLFKFLIEYAKATNMAGVYLGKVPTNDIKYSDLKTAQVPPVDKVGGYLSQYTSTQIRPGRYYFETHNQRKLVKIWAKEKK